MSLRNRVSAFLHPPESPIKAAVQDLPPKEDWDDKALCERYLRPGEALRGPDDWSLSPSKPAFVVEIGYPEAGQSFNGFADGWGPTPEAAWHQLSWKLVERETSGRFMWPRGIDRWPEWPSREDVVKQEEFYRKSMSDMGYEYAKAFLWPQDLIASLKPTR